MSKNRVYHDIALSSGTEVELDADASNHLLRILHLKINDELILFNGQGGEYNARIIDINGKKSKTTNLQITDYSDINHESRLNICLLQSISRGERMTYTIQKAVELGVSEIIPLSTEYSQLTINHGNVKKLQQRWQKIAIIACEQCGRNNIPLIHNPLFFQTYLENSIPFSARTEEELGIIADCSGSKKIAALHDKKPQKLSILIGPEGDFSTAEITQAHQFGFESVTLGPRILRTETAGMVAIAIAQSLWGDI